MKKKQGWIGGARGTKAACFGQTCEAVSTRMVCRSASALETGQIDRLETKARTQTMGCTWMYLKLEDLHHLSAFQEMQPMTQPMQQDLIRPRGLNSASTSAPCMSSSWYETRPLLSCRDWTRSLSSPPTDLTVAVTSFCQLLFKTRSNMELHGSTWNYIDVRSSLYITIPQIIVL